MDCGYGNARGTLQRKAVHAGADCREGNGTNGVLAGEFQAAAVATGEKLVLAVCAAVPDGADGMKDPFGRQTEAGRGLGIAGRAAMELAAGFEKLRAGSPVNGAINTSAAEQGRIGSVDDGVYGELGDVSGDGDEPGHENQHKPNGVLGKDFRGPKRAFMLSHHNLNWHLRENRMKMTRYLSREASNSL
jgi:hypothetical protein